MPSFRMNAKSSKMTIPEEYHGPVQAAGIFKSGLEFDIMFIQCKVLLPTKCYKWEGIRRGDFTTSLGAIGLLDFTTGSLILVKIQCWITW